MTRAGAAHRPSCAVYDPTPGYCDCGYTEARGQEIEREAHSKIADPIVGHKTFQGDDGTTRHEPLRQSEAEALMRSVEDAKQRRAELMPTEQEAAQMMLQAWYRLKELGWRETCYGPTGEVVQLIEPGSSGIHEGHRPEEWPSKTWWIYSGGDSWPSNPCLFKLKARPQSDDKGGA